MNKLLILIFTFIFLQNLLAQEKTLVNPETEITSGGFGGPVLKYTTLNNHGGLLVGGRGGWIINHSFILGGGFYGLATEVPVDVLISGDIILKNADNLNMYYGGLEFEYVVAPLQLVHLSFYSLLGMGYVGYRKILENEICEKECKEKGISGDVYFVFEPAINIEMNITTFFRINAGLSYRFTEGAEYQAIADNNLSGFNGILTFKFGNF